MTKKMTKEREIKNSNAESSSISTQNNIPNTVDELREKLVVLQQKELEEAHKQVFALGEKLKVGIGLQLDSKKLGDIIAFMINNNKPFITLQFEVWKESK